MRKLAWAVQVSAGKTGRDFLKCERVLFPRKLPAESGDLDDEQLFLRHANGRVIWKSGNLERNCSLLTGVKAFAEAAADRPERDEHKCGDDAGCAARGEAESGLEKKQAANQRSD